MQIPNNAGTDQLLLDIADYTLGYTVSSKEAIKTARYAILDAVGEPFCPHAQRGSRHSPKVIIPMSCRLRPDGA